MCVFVCVRTNENKRKPKEKRGFFYMTNENMKIKEILKEKREFFYKIKTSDDS